MTVGVRAWVRVVEETLAPQLEDLPSSAQSRYGQQPMIVHEAPL